MNQTLFKLSSLVYRFNISISVAHAQVYLLPTMNPDGYEHTNLLGHSPTRGNGNSVDLNRAFPTWKDLGQDRAELKEGRENEVKVMIDWIMQNPFLLSINFHGGAGQTRETKHIYEYQHICSGCQLSLGLN